MFIWSQWCAWSSGFRRKVSTAPRFLVAKPRVPVAKCDYAPGFFEPYCIVLYCVLYLGKSTDTVYSKKEKKKKEIKKPRSLRYIDTDFRWADSRGIRYNRFYVIANYVISVVTCIHFKWSSAGPRRGLRNNRELRYIGLRYIDSWL